MQEKEAEVDPSDYLYNTTKYYDTYVNIRDPQKGDVKKIGVSVRHLAAHSKVFREMFAGDLTGRSFDLPDISFEVFHLILKHVYGGQLSSISRDMAIELVRQASKYEIKALVTRACVFLVPATIEQLFPALSCVVTTTVPLLEPHVQKMVQENTNHLVNDNEFLSLDENCLEYITKQDKLAITEVELWKALVKWAEAQGKEKSEVRKLLNKPLQNVRLLTLTQEEVLNEIVPLNILSPVESVKLINAVTSNQILDSPGICTSKVKRTLCKVSPLVRQEVPEEKENVFDLVFSCSNENFTEKHPTNPSYSYKYTLMQESNYKSISNFIVKTYEKDVQIVSLTCKTTSYEAQNYQPNYTLSCNITVNMFQDGYCKETYYVKTSGGLVMCDKHVSLPLMMNGKHLVLKANSWYNFNLKFSSAHPAFTGTREDGYSNQTQTKKSLIGLERNVPKSIIATANELHFTIQFVDTIHVMKIDYKVPSK